MANYYEILGCGQGASYDELKQAYHELALKHHPDKNGGDSSSSGDCDFQSIDEAWKTLRDQNSRKAYDENLKQKELEDQNLLFGTFKLGQLHFDKDSQIYSHRCKCGGLYSFSKKDFEEFNSYLVGCDMCSLMISVDLQT